MKLGAQLYTVRHKTKTPEDFAETLARVAEIGYTSVQVSATCAYEPEWLAEQLKINGLVCPVTHFNAERIADDGGAVALEHRVYDCGIVGLGSAPGIWLRTFSYEKFRDKYLPAALNIRGAGAMLGYHNHSPEFRKSGGTTILERIAEDFPADALSFIFDTYWAQFAGHNPAEWIRRLAGRVHCVHLKDLKKTLFRKRMAVVGEGMIDFDAVISACEASGTQYLLVEQDNCYGEEPFDCLTRSYRNLRAMGLE